MRVDFMLAAEAATVTQDNKISMLGADLQHIYAPTAPVVIPFFSVVLKIEFTREEAVGSHVLEILIVNEVTQSSVTIMRNEFANLSPDDTTETAVLRAISTNVNTTFSTFGNYSIRAVVDGRVVHNLPIFVQERLHNDH